MDKGNIVTGSRTPSGAGQGKKRMPFWGYLVLSLVAVGLGMGLAVYFVQARQSSQAGSAPITGGPLGIATIGRPAPGFSLMDRNGLPYTLTPGDGKNHLLVFYMGYF